jgi:hypothetical protein
MARTAPNLAKTAILAVAISFFLFGAMTLPEPAATSDRSSSRSPPADCVGARHAAGGPDGMGGCWPGPSNTGIPAGHALTAYTGPCKIALDNTVLDGKLVTCQLNIQASNITIRNSKVIGGIWLDGDLPGSSSWSVTIEDTEVDGGPNDLPSIGNANVNVIRANIYGGHNGVQCDETSVFCTVRDSWIHDQYQPPDRDSHLGGFLSNGGQNIVLRHNFIVCDAPVNKLGGGCTGNINLIPNFKAIDGAVIEHNLLGANLDSSYCTYGGEKSTSETPHSFNIIYKDNIFQRGRNRRCAAYGPVTGFNWAGSGNAWINNRWDDGAIVPGIN